MTDRELLNLIKESGIFNMTALSKKLFNERQALYRRYYGVVPFSPEDIIKLRKELGKILKGVEDTTSDGSYLDDYPGPKISGPRELKGTGKYRSYQRKTYYVRMYTRAELRSEDLLTLVGIIDKDNNFYTALLNEVDPIGFLAWVTPTDGSKIPIDTKYIYKLISWQEPRYRREKQALLNKQTS